MEDSADEFIRQPIGRFEWERILRRVQVSVPSVKLVGFAMASYANADGSKIRPGQKRLAAVLGTSEMTVRRGQGELEMIGLLEMVFKGHSLGRGRAAGFASEYRLTVPSDLLERVPMLDPEEAIYRTPTNGDSGKDRTPMSAESEELPDMGEEIPDTGEETPDIWSELPDTHVPPPDHYHHIKDHNKKHQSGPVTLSDAHASEILTDLFHNGTDDYASASTYLQRLPDFGQSHLRQVPAEQSIKERVIAAAKLAGWTAERKAS
jgi:hypothetical protein